MKEAHTLPEKITLLSFQASATTISFSLPKGDSVADAIEKTISNVPSFTPLPDASDEAGQ